MNKGSKVNYFILPSHSVIDFGKIMGKTCDLWKTGSDPQIEV